MFICQIQLIMYIYKTGGIPIIAENSELLNEISIIYPWDDMSLKNEFFSSIKNARNLTRLVLNRLSKLEFSSLSDHLTEELPNIITLSLSGGTGINRQNKIKDLKGIELFTELKTLTINYTSTNLDISAIKNCPTLEDVSLAYDNINTLNGIEGLTNLKTLKINNNNITSLKLLENLKNLTSLNLKNNAIADTSSYVDTDGSTKTYRNLDILAGLHTSRGGKLTTLYLAGNDNIIDYSSVSSLTWNDKSGF